MRSIALGLVFGLLLVFVAQDFARGDDEPETPQAALKAVRARLDVLEAESAYLRAREASVSRYVLANEERAEAIAKVVARVRELGFESRSIPADSRSTLLAGFEGLAAHLRKGLPQPTQEERDLLKAVEKARAAAGGAGR